MKKINLFLAGLLTLALNVNAQNNLDGQKTCTTVASLDLSTGKNAVTGAQIPAGMDDPNWKITFLTPALTNIAGAVSLGLQAKVCTPSWNVGPGGNSSWISFIANDNYATVSGDEYAYGFEATRQFRVCADDSFKIDFKISIDNFYGDIKIDGISYYNQAPTLDPNNYNLYTQHTLNVLLASGDHTISVLAYNKAVDANSNPHRFVLSGIVASKTGNNTLVSATETEDCVCGKPTGINNNNDGKPGNFLEQNFPNPFGTEASVNYYVRSFNESAVIIVRDAQGKEVLKHNILSAGKGTINLDAGKLYASGNYICSLVIDGAIADTKKMVFVK